MTNTSPEPTQEELRRVQAYLRSHETLHPQHARDALQMSIPRIWACMEKIRQLELPIE